MLARIRSFVTESASNNTRRCRLRHYSTAFDRRACTPRVFRSRHGRKVHGYRRANDTLDRRLESRACVRRPIRRLPLKDIVSQEFKFIPKATPNTKRRLSRAIIFHDSPRVLRASGAIFPGSSSGENVYRRRNAVFPIDGLTYDI